LDGVAAALRNTTEVLARELACSSNQAPTWTEFEWLIARSVVAMHGIASLLLMNLRWLGPPAWQQFLDEQRRQTAARHVLIAELLDMIDARARTANVVLVALKGAALHARKIYAAGERPMADIDLLVHADDASAAARLLTDCGYAASCNIRRHQIFLPVDRGKLDPKILGEHVDTPIKIELHTRIYEHLPVSVTDITPEVYPFRPIAGLNSYPSSIALMLHLLLHAAGNIRARALRLIQLHDIAALAGHFTKDDWSGMLSPSVQRSKLWWAFPPLALTSNYYPRSIPPEVLASVRKQCPRLLRARRFSLTDVSWSNIRIEALPGWEWSRTPREVAQFLGSRIWPSAIARAELKKGAAAIPGSCTVGWYESSHRTRILRWVFSRPPRVQTLLSVRAALHHAAE
jgi:hypothetical protein